MGATNLERAIVEKNFLFGLAKKTPIFIVNKRLYYCTNDDASPDFFIKDRNSSKSLRVMEGPSLDSLEKISSQRLEEDYQKFMEEFAVEELKRLNSKDSDFDASSAYKKLTLFALKEIFPYLRKDNSKELDDVLEVEPENSKPSKEDIKPDKKNDKEIQDYVEKRVTELGMVPARMKYPVKKISNSKLDRLFFRVGREDLDKEEASYSLITKIIGSPNFALDKDYSYVLENIVYGLENLNIKGAKYRLLEPYPILELQRNFSAEIIRELSIEALKNKLKDTQEFEEFKKKRDDLETLCNKKEYHERDFGFKRYRNQNNLLFIYVDVPDYVLEDPSDKRLYQFSGHELGVTILLNDNNQPALNAGPFGPGGIAGPFYGGGGLCMGGYSRGYFSNMPIGKAFAKLLVDARNVVLHGYTERAGPYHPLYNFSSRSISAEEVKRRNLPITNIQARSYY